MTRPRPHPPRTRPRRAALLVAIAAVVAAIAVGGTGIGAADPVTTPAPAPTPPPTLTTPAPPSVLPPLTAPTTSGVPAPAGPGGPIVPGQTGGAAGASDCGVTHIADCVSGAIDGFFRRLVDSALDPLLELLSQHLLTTPDPSTLPGVKDLWDSSWQLMVAVYGLVVIAAGILLMAHETLQTRWGVRELLPRLVGGFLAGATSMVLATKAIQFANGLAVALLGPGVSPDSAGAALKSMLNVGAGTATPLFFTLLRNALVVVLAILLITYIIRVAITVVLIVAAPLAMMCWALPATEGVARWWWRAFSACLTIQVVQSLVLITGLRVFLTPGGWWFFGTTKSGLTSLLVALAMGFLLMKTPFWLLSALKISQGRGIVSSLVRSFLAYKTLGLLKGAGKSSPGSRAKAKTRPNPGPADPYANVKATRTGQLMLPLPGIRRVKPGPPPPTRIPHAATIPVAQPQGEQMMLPLPQFHGGVDLGPKPHLGRDGQYQLPIPVDRVTKPATPRPPLPRPSTPARGTARPKQLAFDFTAPAEPDPYAGNRPIRGGQYPLPIEVRRVPPPPRKPTPPPLEKPPSPSVGRQLHLPMPDLPVRRRRRPSGGTR